MALLIHADWPLECRLLGGRPEVLAAVKVTRLMWWTTPAPGIECAKG